ncbi:MAG: hypothetical protein ABSC49_04125 [Candidatus Microgenomates bacterium]|jgi:hypothetical protein
MQVETDDKSSPNTTDIIYKEAKKLRDADLREMTPKEIEEMKKEFQQHNDSLIHKIARKIGF